jgi:hypothetical protein
MFLSSREYQHRLAPRLFPKGDTDVSRFLAFAAGLDPRVRLTADSLRRSDFTRELLDTRDRTFGGRGLKLRLRKYSDRLTCTFKAIGLDRYAVRKARVRAADPFRSKAATKFEEGIYALHSAFSKQTTIPLPLGWQFGCVSDWARLFPSALEVVPAHAEPLVVTSQIVIRRTHKMILDFGETQAEAMLELGFSPASEIPETADFSWKYRHKKERFTPNAVTLMRRFSQALNQCTWADPDVHLRKALLDAGASSSSHFAERFVKPPARSEEDNAVVATAQYSPTSTSTTTMDSVLPEAPVTEPEVFTSSAPPDSNPLGASEPPENVGPDGDPGSTESSR